MVNTYRIIAIQLLAKQKAARTVLDKSALASKAIEKLTNTLVELRGELVPMSREHEQVRGDWEEFDGQIKGMLGGYWEEFKKAVDTEVGYLDATLKSRDVE
jgi:hypothetical protein